jgi:hypothetical protein
MAILKESDSLPTETRMSAEQKREILLEAARGATWDTTRGPMHLRTGRFFVSQVHAAHAYSEWAKGAAPEHTHSKPTK